MRMLCGYTLLLVVSGYHCLLDKLSIPKVGKYVLLSLLLIRWTVVEQPARGSLRVIKQGDSYAEIECMICIHLWPIPRGAAKKGLKISQYAEF